MAELRKTLASGRPLIWCEECRSTNDVAMRCRDRGEIGPLWVAAARQTRGRGRSRRAWQSHEGNLHASLLVVLGCSPEVVSQLSLVAGTAVYDAIGAAYGSQGHGAPSQRIWLKWPNDIMTTDGKVGGILIETNVQAGFREVPAVIGVGLNLATCPQDIDRPATTLKAFFGHAHEIHPIGMLSHLDQALMQWIETWQCGAGFDRVRQGWLERAGRLGDEMSVNTGGGVVSGRYMGLDEEGRLLVRQLSGEVERVSFGDVDFVGS